MRAARRKRQSIAAVEAELLKLVRRHGRISRVGLARELKVVPSTAGIYVDRLRNGGFLMESRRKISGFGRPPALLTLNPEAGRFVGLDFEARNLLATAVDFSQQKLREIHLTIRPAESLPQILAKMDRAIEDVMAGDPRPVLGIGLGVPGVIDPEAGIAVRYDLIKGWRNIDLGTRFRKRFRAPVFLENNIRSMALAELWFGRGRGLKDFVCIGVRSGIAAGVVVNGQLMRGSANQAGEIGHWACPVPDQLTPKPTGKPGYQWLPGVRLEQVASVSAILAAARRAVDAKQPTLLANRGREISLADLFEAIRAGDSFACSLLEAAAGVHGWAVCQLNAIFNPQAILFTGPLTELGELFLAPARAAARQWNGGVAGVEILGSALGQYNGALGAAALALHQWKPKC